MKHESEVKPVLLLAVCLGGGRNQYLQVVRQNLTQCGNHCLPLTDSVFLLDEIEAAPGLLNVVALCNRESIPLCVLELSDAPALISPDTPYVIEWLRERGYSEPKLTRFPPPQQPGPNRP
jgi:hypothetical protein